MVEDCRSIVERPSAIEERIGVTVCIAAMCENGIILGASDRMITWGDVQFEHQAPKARALTSSITVMTSGDAALLRETVLGVEGEIAGLLSGNLQRWLDIREVADMFVRHRNLIKLRRAEAALLAPLGLNQWSFLQGLHSLGVELNKTIATDLIQFPMPYTAFIISGVDASGAHIYTVTDGALVCNDAMAFAAIGFGARHAESQFMLSQHAVHRSLAETFLLIYLAKKRAEVAPGVGSETDLFTVGPHVGTLSWVTGDPLTQVHVEYDQLIKDEGVARANARTRMEAYIGELRRNTPAVQEAEPAPDAAELADDTDAEQLDQEEPDGSPDART
jgi:hypothetical protein